ncbi:MAG TPA: DUF5702 domain-containing protein [Clostridiales bacterium]|nr:DUF5702 domain-containing protein [Clostridiales bacterium]
MNLNNNKGQIAIFLAIVFISVLFLCGILIDRARIIGGRANVNIAVEDALRSTMALYNSRLKNDYGIFALSENDDKALEDTVKEYISKNLSIDVNRYYRKKSSDLHKSEDYPIDLESFMDYPIDLYDFRIEELSVAPIYNLTGNDALKKQILEYMKYRAPKELGENILKKLDIIKDAGKMAELYEKKVDIERELEDIDSIQRKIKKNISGTIGDGIFEPSYIEKFNKDGERDNLVNRYVGLIERYASLESAIESGDEEECNDYDMKIMERMKIKKEIQSVFKELTGRYTIEFTDINEEAIANIAKLIKQGKKISTEIKELCKTAEFKLHNTEISDDIEFREAFTEDINNLMKLVPDIQEGQKKIDILKNNISALYTSIDNFNDIQNKVEMEDITGVDVFEIEKNLKDVNSNYSTIEFNYKLHPKTGDQDDPRKGLGQRLKNVLTEVVRNGLDIEEKDIDFSELPSRKKVKDKDFSEEDWKYESSLDRLDKEVDLVNTKTTFPQKALNFIIGAGNTIGENLINLRDDIYINQYIIDCFNSRANNADSSRIDKAGNSGADKADDIKDKYKSCFQAEIEYILHGSELEEINVLKTMGQVVLIRFGINTLQIYTDAIKREQAYSLAAVLAGWWTGGAGIPIIANMIICSWGMGEAMNDLRVLMEGKSIPFFKKYNITFSYEDYLWLFLLMKKTDEKIDRIQDLIELNIRKEKPDFKMGNSHTAIRVEVAVSMKYLFATRPFMPSRVKTSDGRHKIYVLLYEGY